MSLNYWLLKTEPENDWSWTQQIKKGTEGWDGVRNYTARKNMLEMKIGDQAFFYHSGKERRIMGIVEIVKKAYPDKTDILKKFVMVDVKTTISLPTPVTLKIIKNESTLMDMQLVRNSRLSVQSVTTNEWKKICKLGGL
ncbi:EVE domain-containing protein [Alphaproteobacteria bacterium]|nr:EVE domain-containing protein [Alphaproteobacteria bacterium]